MLRLVAAWMVVVSVTASAQTARKSFKTKLIPVELDEDRLPKPPAELFSVVKYEGPVGDLQAWVSKPTSPGKHPAIIWITGGFPPGGAGRAAWEEPSPRNDQSASAFRKEGMVLMLPTFRGTYGNGGQYEGFLGEVDDVLAALAWLRRSPDVDPQRIYLGGHSTGGTLALLAAAATDQLRGVVAFGPVENPCNYGPDSQPYDVKDAKECEARSPVSVLAGLRTPTLIIEGESGNTKDAERMQQRFAKNAALTVVVAEGLDHFSVLAPGTQALAAHFAKPKTGTTFPGPAVLRAAFAKPQTPARDLKHPDGWSVRIPAGFEERDDQDEAPIALVFVRSPGTKRYQQVAMQPLSGPLDPQCIPEVMLTKRLGPTAKTLRTKWRELELCGFRSVQEHDGVQVVSIAFEVPTIPRAFIVRVSGLLENEPALLALAQQVTASASGTTNWKR